MNPITTSKNEIEIELKHGEQKALVAPLGASLRRYSLARNGEEWEVIWGYSGAANKVGGQGDVLIPFPNRIKGGTYSLDGRTHQMELTDKDGPNSIHGFLRKTMWSHEIESESAASFTTDIAKQEYASRGYPFSLSVQVRYSLSDGGLTTSFEIKNTGSERAPVGVGFHPYFTPGPGPIDSWNLHIPARHYLEAEQIVPTGRVLDTKGTPFDFQTLRAIGPEKYNHCVCHLERNAHNWAQVTMKHPTSGRELVLHLPPEFDYLVLYSGDNIPAPHTRGGFAIEPQTCGSNAFNQKEWGLRLLEPGETFASSYVIEARW